MAALDIKQSRDHWGNERQQTECRAAASSASISFPPNDSPTDDDEQSELLGIDAVRERIAHAVAARDEQWRRQQRAQLAFVQQDTEQLMGKMQREMERLHTVNKELARRLFVETQKPLEELEQLRRNFSSERLCCADLRRELALAVKRSAQLAQLLERSAHIHKEQTAQYEVKLSTLRAQIRQLNGLLLVKTKSRSIGPTVARVAGGGARYSLSSSPAGVLSGHHSRLQRRSQSGDCSAADGSWAYIASGIDSQQPPLGIDAPPNSTPSRRNQKLMLQHSLNGGTIVAFAEQPTESGQNRL